MSEINNEVKNEVNNEADNSVNESVVSGINGQITDPEVLMAMAKAQEKIAKKAERSAKRAEFIASVKDSWNKKQEERAKLKENKMSSEQMDELIASVKEDDMKVLAQLLVEIKKENDRVVRHARRQSIFSMCTAVFCLVLVTFILVWGIRFVPVIEGLANDATELVANTNGLVLDTTAVVSDATAVIEDATAIVAQTGAIIEQTSAVIDNLDAITTDLAEADIEGMMNNVNNLVVSSEENMSEAIKKISDIDIESLNKAISDLQQVVAPLAKLVRK